MATETTEQKTKAPRSSVAEAGRKRMVKEGLPAAPFRAGPRSGCSGGAPAVDARGGRSWKRTGRS
jgi:hypothetical protein